MPGEDWADLVLDSGELLAEFCDADFVIITANRDLSTVVVKTLDEMLPERFGPKDLL